MKNQPSLTSIVTFLLLSSLLSNSVLAANECKIKYQYNYYSGGKIKQNIGYVTLNLGQTKSVNRSRINYVKNIRDPQIKLYNRNLLTNIKYTYDLARNAQDPITGIHLINVKLEKVKCIRAVSEKNSHTALDVMARQMKATGKSAEQVATHLRNQLGQSMEQTAKWLNMAGYPGEQVAKALHSAFKANATEAAKVLKQVFNTSSTNIAKWLKQGNYSIQGVAQALKQYLGVKAKDAGKILKDVFDASTYSMASALKYAGYKLTQVAIALKSTGVSADDVARTLRDLFSASQQKVAKALKVAGYSAAQIAKALHQTFGTSAAKLRPILVAIGYATSQAATAVNAIKKKYDDRRVVINTINEINMPNANISIVLNRGSNKGYLRLTGEYLRAVTGVSGLPIRSAQIREEKSDFMGLFRNFPIGGSATGSYLLLDLVFLYQAGNWTGATNGTGYLLTEKSRKLTNGQFRWKIIEAAQATCQKGQKLIKGACI
jgi:Holliday junction resolvasome RuvABC DNA-binding subunit